MSDSKLITLDEAVRLVTPGMTLCLGGMTLYRRPMAFVRGLLAQPAPPRGLTLLAFTAGMESDLLLGAGCVATIRTCYFGLEIFGFAPMFSALSGQGAFTILEETEASIAAGLRATLNGLPMLPSTAWIGTDLPALRPDVRTLSDPISGTTLTAFPAIRPDVTVLHALVADRGGNVRLNANWGIDREAALAAETVIVTAEMIVDRLTEDVTIAAPVISAVVHAPRGAWPTSCYPLYPIDGLEILRYVDTCVAGDFSGYLKGFLAGERSGG